MTVFLYKQKMKRAYLLLACSAFLTHPLLGQTADSTNAAAATPPPHVDKPVPPPKPPPVTKEEQTELNTAYADALKTNPDLLTEQNDIKDKQKALREQQTELQQKVNAA